MLFWWGFLVVLVLVLGFFGGVFEKEIFPSCLLLRFIHLYTRFACLKNYPHDSVMNGTLNKATQHLTDKFVRRNLSFVALRIFSQVQFERDTEECCLCILVVSDINLQFLSVSSFCI